VKPGKDRQAVEDTLFAVIERLGRDGPGAEELEKARNQMESEFVFGLEEVQGRAETLGAAALVTGDPAAAIKRLEQMRAVRAEDVRRVVSTYLIPQRRTVVWLLPQERSGS
jgi:zinc protease